MIDHIRKSGGDILRIYHCPHQNQDGCNCRKPKPGLLLQAAKEYGINLAETFFIGDAQRDIEAGRRAGTRTILINKSIQHSEFTIQPDYHADNLLDAAEIIIREIK